MGMKMRMRMRMRRWVVVEKSSSETIDWAYHSYDTGKMNGIDTGTCYVVC